MRDEISHFLKGRMAAEKPPSVLILLATGVSALALA
jgi:hypothetical protein